MFADEDVWFGWCRLRSYLCSSYYHNNGRSHVEAAGLKEMHIHKNGEVIQLIRKLFIYKNQTKIE